MVTDAAIRQGCLQSGPLYANARRRRRPRPGDTWHWDAVFRTIHGARPSRWRAVDQDGHVLDILRQSRRHMKAAKTFFRKLRHGLP
jgi:putative transposase